MMSGLLAMTVSMPATCFSGSKPASVTATTSTPSASNRAFGAASCAFD
jgi:hypothetical protein